MDLVGGMFQFGLEQLFFDILPTFFSTWYFFGSANKQRNPILQSTPANQGWSVPCNHPEIPLCCLK